jgi:hypothetical protein
MLCSWLLLPLEKAHHRYVFRLVFSSVSWKPFSIRRIVSYPEGVTESCRVINGFPLADGRSIRYLLVIPVYIMQLAKVYKYFLPSSFLLHILGSRGQPSTNLEVTSHLLPTLTRQNRWSLKLFGGKWFAVLIPTLEAPKPRSVVSYFHRLTFTCFWLFRLPSHAAAARINLCKRVERDTLVPYL